MAPNKKISLEVFSGKLGYKANWVWYKSGCGTEGERINTGSKIDVEPTKTTTYQNILIPWRLNFIGVRQGSRVDACWWTGGWCTHSESEGPTTGIHLLGAQWGAGPVCPSAVFLICGPFLLQLRGECSLTNFSFGLTWLLITSHNFLFVLKKIFCSV